MEIRPEINTIELSPAEALALGHGLEPKVYEYVERKQLRKEIEARRYGLSKMSLNSIPGPALEYWKEQLALSPEILTKMLDQIDPHLSKLD